MERESVESGKAEPQRKDRAWESQETMTSSVGMESRVVLRGMAKDEEESG